LVVASTPQGAVTDNLLSIRKKVKNYETTPAIGFDQAINKLIGLIPQVDVVIDPSFVGSANNAKYYQRTIYLADLLPAERTILHEMTHAYNDIRLSITSEYIDEALAFGMESFYDVVLTANSMEKGVKDSKACGDLYSTIVQTWPRFWRNWGTLNWPTPDPAHRGALWRDVLLSDGSSFPLAPADISRLKSNYSVTLSCKALAGIINRLIDSKGCCFRVTCAATTQNSQEIPARTQIDQQFQ